MAALASAGAGIIHAAAAPEHSSWAASVVFFVGLAVFQLAWAAYVLAQRPGTTAAALGAAVNLGALAVWAVSRISGLPFGPHQGVAEAASRADLIASALSLIVVVGAVGIARRWEPQPVARMRSALSLSAGGLAVSALSVVALTGVSGHAHPAGHDHTAPLEAQAATCSRDLRAVPIIEAAKAVKNTLEPALEECDGASASEVRMVDTEAPHSEDEHTH